MLVSARRLLRQIVQTLSPEFKTGIPVVGLERACLKAFRDELPNLLSDDPLVRRLADQSHFFSDFIKEHADRLDLAETGAKVLMHAKAFPWHSRLESSHDVSL